MTQEVGFLKVADGDVSSSGNSKEETASSSSLMLGVDVHNNQTCSSPVRASKSLDREPASLALARKLAGD